MKLTKLSHPLFVCRSNMDFSPEYWPKLKIGNLQRQKLLVILKKRLSDYPASPGLTLAEIIPTIEIGETQTKRHLSKLLSQGKIYKEGDYYFYRVRKKSAR